MLFSIIMCTYNSERTVRRALDSMLEQSFCDWELVVLDNGSMDGTIDILREYEKRDKRICCEFGEENVGWCRGISDCLKRASGEYMMFLAGDDMLTTMDSLQEVADEIAKHHPDIVWTGCQFASLEGTEYHITKELIPEYCVYENEDKVIQLAKLMSSVYYNSVMHYVNIEFLKKHDIDFFEPFYGDCEGMTEAICRAEKMVVLDKAEYVLVTNTSQTVQTAFFDEDFTRQWRSVREFLLPYAGEEHYRPLITYIAQRILNNMAAILENIVIGQPVTDAYMNHMERDYAARFLKLEEWLSDIMFGELLQFAEREQYVNRLLYAAGRIYYRYIVPDAVLLERVNRQSRWLCGFIRSFFTVAHANGRIAMREQYSESQLDEIAACIFSSDNRNQIGREYLPQ